MNSYFPLFLCKKSWYLAHWRRMVSLVSRTRRLGEALSSWGGWFHHSLFEPTWTQQRDVIVFLNVQGLHGIIAASRLYLHSLKVVCKTNYGWLPISSDLQASLTPTLPALTESSTKQCPHRAKDFHIAVFYAS